MAGYNLYGDEYNQANKMFPQGMGILELLGAITYGTSADINPYLNIFRYNRQDRIFAQSDQILGSQMIRGFRNETGREPSNTPFGAIGRALGSYIGDDKVLAEKALRQAAVATGAGSYAFGTGGRSMADLYNNWGIDGKASEALVGMMSTFYNSDRDPNLNKGQRNMLLANMLESDPYLLQDYRKAVRELKATDDKGGMGADLEDFGDKLKDVKKSLEEFGAAANNWGRLLKTDAIDAMQKVGDLLGGAAFGSFYGNEQALADMASNIKHVGGITGRGAETALAMVQQAGVLLKQAGGPADTAVNVGTYAMLESSGLAGWRTTQEEADKAALQMNANFQKSEAGGLFFGGYSEYLRKNSGSGKSAQELQREWTDLIRDRGLSVSSVNEILGENYGVGNYRIFAKRGDARDFAASSNEFSLMALQGSREETLNLLSLMSGDERLSASRIDQLSKETRTDVLRLASMSYNQRQKEYQRNNVSEANQRRIEDFSNAFADRMQAALDTGALGITGDYETWARMYSTTHIENVRRMDEQKDIRTKISRATSGKGIAGILNDVVQNNTNFAIGDILAALGGDELSGEAIDEAFRLNSTKEVRDQVIQNISNLGNEEDISIYKKTINRFLKKAANNALTKEDYQDLADIGLDYHKYTDRSGKEIEELTTNQGGISEERIRELKERDKKRTEEEKKDNETLLNKMTKDEKGEDLTGMKGVQSKMKYASYQAMLNLARDYVETAGKEDEDAKIAQQYIAAVKSGNMDDATKYYDTLKSKKIGDNLETETSKIMESVGISRDQAGYAAAISEGVSALVNQMMKVIKDGKVNVNVDFF